MGNDSIYAFQMVGGACGDLYRAPGLYILEQFLPLDFLSTRKTKLFFRRLFSTFFNLPLLSTNLGQNVYVSLQFSYIFLRFVWESFALRDVLYGFALGVQVLKYSVKCGQQPTTNQVNSFPLPCLHNSNLV